MPVNVLAFTIALWLGSHLLARDVRRPALRSAGLGLLLYALALAGELIMNGSSAVESSGWLVRLSSTLLFLPALLWAGTLAYLLPDDTPSRAQYIRIWQVAVPLLMVGFITVSLTTPLIFTDQGGIQPAGYAVAGGIALLPLAEGLFLLAAGLRRAGTRRQVGLLFIGLLFFSLSTTLLLVPTMWIPRLPLLLGIGCDLLILGLLAAALDAFQEGEAWLPELLRSLHGAIFFLILFAGPVALTMTLATGPTGAMYLLLLAIISVAVLAQNFERPIQSLLDALAYARFPRLRQIQEELRSEAKAQARLGDFLDPASMEEEEFARLTRRALSHYGNLPKLSNSPLTKLPVVQERLTAHGHRDSTLERAAALKSLLAESIERLRPTTGQENEFSSTEEWRHFNALYYPYVAGLRPYSRRTVHDVLTDTEQEALFWFQAAVPERTLYNWQRSAAELVAQDLREQCAA